MLRIKRLHTDPYSLGPYLLWGQKSMTLRLGLWLAVLRVPWR